MVFILLTFFAILFVLLSKHLFQKWFNHLSIYVVIWFFLLTLYEMKLFHYYDLTFKTWFVVVCGFLCYFLGVITYFVARQSRDENNFYNSGENIKIQTSLFEDDAKVLKIAIIITSLAGLIEAIQSWMVLLHKFKTIQNIIILANTIYRMRVQGDFGFLPYLSAFSFVSVFLGGIYTARTRKLTFYIILPLLVVIIQDLANLGRAGMLFALVEFISVLILYRHRFSENEAALGDKSSRKLVISVVMVFILLIGGATAVRSVRGTVESFGSASNTLNKFKGNIVITPSIYLYFSSDVGVLNKYLESDGEKTSFGENLFLPVYNVLSKLGIVSKPSVYQKGYYIPMWTNTGTYLRELHADFGMTGVLLFPYSLGLFLTFLWFKFNRSLSIEWLVVLVYLYVVVFFSFLVLAPRLGDWVISFVLLLITIPLLNKISNFLILRKHNNLKSQV